MKKNTKKILLTNTVILGLGSLVGCGSSNSGAPSKAADDNVVQVALCTGTAIVPQRLFLQQIGHNRAIIKWRGNRAGGAEAANVCFGTNMNALPLSSRTNATVTATAHHEVLLTGLTPDTTYYYSVGGAGRSDVQHSFRTAPAPGNVPSDGNTRLWILGDAGTAGYGAAGVADQRAVQTGYLNWINSPEGRGEATDLLLTLGDNAYINGTDAEHQAAVFDIYTDMLRKVSLWPTIGNHEMGGGGTTIFNSTELYAGAPAVGAGPIDAPPDSRMPYINIHTLPTNGETGGVPSGTEQYYSFNYGNVHVVSLDSQLSIRDATLKNTMRNWLINDLSANTSDWTVVIFHHPPYTKGSHDSDTTAGGIDQPIFDIREQFTEIFEDHGVDVVYSGHSHSYERSFYVNGHTGLAASFVPATHAEVNADGSPMTGQGAQTYGQVAKNGLDDKVVYTVAGNAGQAGSTSAGYPHPVMASSNIDLGSVVIDATRRTLTARFIDSNGIRGDFFTINR